jgi:hypothetical protein
MAAVLSVSLRNIDGLVPCWVQCCAGVVFGIARPSLVREHALWRLSLYSRVTNPAFGNPSVRWIVAGLRIGVVLWGVYRRACHWSFATYGLRLSVGVRYHVCRSALHRPS